MNSKPPLIGHEISPVAPNRDVQPLPHPPAEGLLRWLFRPVRLQRCAGERQFIIRILVQQFAVKLVTGVLLTFVLPDAAFENQDELFKEPLLAFIIVVFVAPPIETLFLQAAPIEILRALRRSRTLQFISGVIPFAALHFPGGVVSGLAAGVVGGVFFSHTYLECRAKSLWTALWVTTITHGIHNLVVIPFALLLAQ